MKTISSHAHITRSWYVLGVLFKISDEHPRHYIEVTRGLNNEHDTSRFINNHSVS